MWPLAYLYIWGFSFLLSLLSVKLSLKLAFQTNLYDDPGPRKLQIQPVPLLGGLGIFLAFYGSIFVNLALLKLAVHIPAFSGWIPNEIIHYAPNAFQMSKRLLAIMGGSLLVFSVGLMDDVKELGVWPKLSAQILGAIILFLADFRITFFSHSMLLSFILTVLWVVAITNAFNLLDNMDGLSSGVALVSSLFLLIAAMFGNQYFVSLFLVAFIGSLLGFWVFNHHPAKIYMGDAGSYFIGFVMASVTLLGTYYSKESPTFFSILMPVLVLGVPIYDLLSVVIIRLYEKRPIFKGDKKHFSHRLLDLGMNQNGAVFFLYLVSFAFGASSLLLGMVEEWGLYFIFLQSLAFIAIIALLEYFGRKSVK